jgi:hypothetical protein
MSVSQRVHRVILRRFSQALEERANAALGHIAPFSNDTISRVTATATAAAVSAAASLSVLTVDSTKGVSIGINDNTCRVPLPPLQVTAGSVKIGALEWEVLCTCANRSVSWKK